MDMDQLAALGLAEARSSPDLALQESGIREFVELRAEWDADAALNMLSQSQGGEPEDWRTWLMQNLTKILAHPTLPGPWRERLQFHFEELHRGAPQLALRASPEDPDAIRLTVKRLEHSDAVLRLAFFLRRPESERGAMMKKFVESGCDSAYVRCWKGSADSDGTRAGRAER